MDETVLNQFSWACLSKLDQPYYGSAFDFRRRLAKYRSKMAVYLEILGALLEQARLPTNLAQIVNVNLARLDEYLEPLLSAGLVKMEKVEAHEVLAITAEGRSFWDDLYKLEKKLNPGLTRAPSSGRVWS